MPGSIFTTSHSLKDLSEDPPHKCGGGAAAVAEAQRQLAISGISMAKKGEATPPQPPAAAAAPPILPLRAHVVCALVVGCMKAQT